MPSPDSLRRSWSAFASASRRGRRHEIDSRLSWPLWGGEGGGAEGGKHERSRTPPLRPGAEALPQGRPQGPQSSSPRERVTEVKTVVEGADALREGAKTGMPGRAVAGDGRPPSIEEGNRKSR